MSTDPWGLLKAEPLPVLAGGVVPVPATVTIGFMPPAEVLDIVVWFAKAPPRGPFWWT